MHAKIAHITTSLSFEFLHSPSGLNIKQLRVAFTAPKTIFFPDVLKI